MVSQEKHSQVEAERGRTQRAAHTARSSWHLICTKPNCRFHLVLYQRQKLWQQRHTIVSQACIPSHMLDHGHGVGICTWAWLPGSSYERVKLPAPKWAVGISKSSPQPSVSQCCAWTDLPLCYKKKKINRKKWDLWKDCSTRKNEHCLEAWWKTRSLKMTFHREQNKTLENDTRYKRWQTSSLWNDTEQ